MNAEQVQEQIHAAFAGLPVPKPRKLIRHGHDYERSGETKIQQALAGKSWQSLTPEFLAKWWSSFGYLSPEAYRYYLPAILMAALQEPLNDHNQKHTAVWMLRPSFWDLYYNGEDNELLPIQSAFTRDQYLAVCAFLGLMRHQLVGYPHIVMQALHWGWNRYPNPELEAANAYYEMLRTFSYPDPQDPEISALLHEIRAAFAQTPYPGDDQLSGSEQGDEPAENAMELRGIPWLTAHPILLARCHTALSFLSTDGFRYYLPAFLSADLLAFDSVWKAHADANWESNAEPVFELTRGLYDDSKEKFDMMAFPELLTGVIDRLEEAGFSREEALEMLKRNREQKPTPPIDWYKYTVDRMKPFAQEERRAIIHYLEYRAQSEAGIHSGEIHQALERYWRPSVQ